MRCLCWGQAQARARSPMPPPATTLNPSSSPLSLVITTSPRSLVNRSTLLSPGTAGLWWLWWWWGGAGRGGRGVRL